MDRTNMPPLPQFDGMVMPTSFNIDVQYDKAKAHFILKIKSASLLAINVKVPVPQDVCPNVSLFRWLMLTGLVSLSCLGYTERGEEVPSLALEGPEKHPKHCGCTDCVTPKPVIMLRPVGAEHHGPHCHCASCCDVAVTPKPPIAVEQGAISEFSPGHHGGHCKHAYRFDTNCGQ